MVCLPFADDPARLFPYLPGVKPLMAAIPAWPERIQQVTGHGLGAWPIMKSLADQYRDYARGLEYTDITGTVRRQYTEAEIEGEAEDGGGHRVEQDVMPLGHLIDVTPAGLLQCCLQQCLPFQTDDPTLVKDVRPAKAHPPLPARDRPRLIEMLAHALLRYDSGCQTMALGEHGHIQGEVFACLRTLQWLADMFPYLEMPLRAAIRAPDLKDLTVHQIGQWLHGAPRVLQAFMALPNAAYNNMDASWRAFARNPLDYALDRSRQTILGSTYPGSSHVEAAPLATLKNLLYTKRWPRALDHQLLVDVLLVRMRAAFRRYGPPEWKDAPIYAVLSAIFQCLGMEAIAVSPANIVQRLRRLTKAISVARNVPGPAEAPRP